MDETKLGDKVKNTVLLRDLQRDGEVVQSLGREEHIDSLLLEGRVWWLVTNLNNVQLGPSSRPNCKGKQLSRVGSAVELDGSECSSVTFDGLGDASLDRIKLHGALDLETVLTRLASVGVRRDTDKDKPFFVVRYSIVDDLVRSEVGVSVKHLSLISA